MSDAFRFEKMPRRFQRLAAPFQDALLRTFPKPAQSEANGAVEESKRSSDLLRTLEWLLLKRFTTPYPWPGSRDT